MQKTRQRRGNIQRSHVVLSLKLFDDRPKRLRLAIRERGGNPLFELHHPLLVDRSNRRQVHLRNLLPSRALDDPQHVALARRDKQDRLAAASGAPGSPDAMNVRLTVIRHVVIHDMKGREVLNTTTQGPFLLANLPQGEYKVSARYEGQTRRSTVRVDKAAHHRVIFEWA